MEGTRVRVALRCRPPIAREAHHTFGLLTLDPGGSSVCLRSKDERPMERTFMADHVFDQHATQEDVYFGVGVDSMVEAVVSGYNATIFAYGQTGSGKTYCIEGFEYAATAGGRIKSDWKVDEGRLGIVPRVIGSIFSRMAEAAEQQNFKYRARCSYLQIYQERVYDLLNVAGGPGGVADATGSLRMRWNQRDEFYVENLFVCECRDSRQMLELFRRGSRAKAMGAHGMNAASSRSHCVFTVQVEVEDPASPGEIRVSKFNVVDLAGSERLSQTQSTGGRMKEGIAINQSLFALRKVISGLADGAGPQHVPYRDSKLTSLLKQSLGGSSLTLMLACLSPSDEAADENVSTLEYATRARAITNRPVVNEDPKAAAIRRLREEVAFLRGQLAQLEHVVVLPDGSRVLPAPHAPPGPPPPPAAPPAPAGFPLEVDASELGARFVESVDAIKELLEANRRLRLAYAAATAARADTDVRPPPPAAGAHGRQALNVRLMEENAELRERIEILEGVVNGEDPPQPRPRSAASAPQRPAARPLSQQPSTSLRTAEAPPVPPPRDGPALTGGAGAERGHQPGPRRALRAQRRHQRRGREQRREQRERWRWGVWREPLRTADVAFGVPAGGRAAAGGLRNAAGRGRPPQPR